MVTSQEFICELRTRKVLSEKHIVIIEQSLLQPADEIPASDLADYLVEQMIISAAVSNAILDHLQAREDQSKHSDKPSRDDSELRLIDEGSIVNLKPTSAPVVPQESQLVQVSQPPSLHKPEPSSRSPQTSVSVPPKSPPKITPPTLPPKRPPQPPEHHGNKGGLEENGQTVAVTQALLKKGSWRLDAHKRDNKWDTPLVRYGIISLGLLFLASVVLVWLLMQRRADEVLAVADEAYQNGAYSQGIEGYNDFINAFENNANVPRAKLRISLAKIRLITETKSNWDKALALLQEELPEMSQLPDFASEGRIELSAILPNIAEGLAVMADQSDSTELIAQAETALKMIDEHVPSSMRPFNRLQTARRSLELTQRRIARNAEIVAAQAEIADLLKKIKTIPPEERDIIRQQLADCYAILMRYLHAHPEMQGDAVVIAIKNDIARTEAACQKWVAKSTDAQATAESTLLPVSKPVLLLTHRAGPPLESTTSDRLFVSYAGEHVYAINTATGEIVWRYHVGPLRIDRVAPLIISGLPDNNTLLADDRTRSLVMVDTATGSERFRISLGETIYINPQPMWPINFVTSTEGKLMLIDLRKGEQLGHVDLMQKADAPPCYDPERQLVVQPAHHSALHVFRYTSASAEPLVNIGIVPTGHLAGTIYAAPIVHQGYLIVAEQTSPNRSTIKVFAPTNADSSTAANAVPWANVPVQVVTLDGLVKSPPIINGNDLLYQAERGDIKLLSFVGSEPAKPYQVLAEGRIDESRNRGEAVSGRFSLLADRSFWVADNRLQRLEIQPSRSRFIPQPTPTTPNIISQSPLDLVDGHLLQTYIDPVLGGVVSRSFALSNLAIRWQTEFGEAVLAQPIMRPDETLHLATLTGKLFDIPFATLTSNPDSTQYRTESYLRQHIATGTLPVPVTDCVPLENGLEVLCCIAPNTPMTYIPQPSFVYVYDGKSPQMQIRILSVPAPLTSAAVPLGRGIVLPFANGQLALYLPADGTVIGNPLIAQRTADAPPKWSPMALISKKQLAYAADTTTIDSDIDEAILVGDANGLLRQVELREQNNRLALIETKSVQLPCPIVSKPFLCGRNVIVADDAGCLVLFDYDQLTTEGNILQPPKKAAANTSPVTQEQATPVTQSAVNKTYGGVIVTGDIESQPEPVQTDTVQADAEPSDESDLATDLPYRAWELDGPVVWGPFACGKNAVVAVTEQNTFVTITQADQSPVLQKAVIQKLPLEHGLPVGKPFAMSENQLLFITRNGTLMRYDLPQGTLTPIISTGISPSCGPVILHSKIIVFGADGAIYTF